MTRSSASASLTWAASRNLRPPVLHEWDAPAAELHLEEIAVMGGSHEDRLFLEGDARLPVLENAAAYGIALSRLVHTGP